MQTFSTLALAAIITIRGCSALDIPTNIKSFRSGLVSAGSCKNKLANGFFASDEGPNSFSYCGDHLADSKVIYLQGTGGALADMDIDCDGQPAPRAGDDGRCGHSSDTQSETSFKDTVAGYGKGVKDLNPFVHPYVVFGNVGSKAGHTVFEPASVGIEPLSLMAVVCGDKMFYGIWGDENGVDGEKSVIGEASISIATQCFGKSIKGNSGHDDTDVLYIAFAGKDAVPGASAKWDAKSPEEFQDSVKTLGDLLVQRIGGSGSTTGAPSGPAKTTLQTTSKPQPTGTCSWTGHCVGASCSAENDCDGQLTCKQGKCA